MKELIVGRYYGIEVTGFGLSPWIDGPYNSFEEATRAQRQQYQSCLDSGNEPIGAWTTQIFQAKGSVNCSLGPKSKVKVRTKRKK